MTGPVRRWAAGLFAHVVLATLDKCCPSSTSSGRPSLFSPAVLDFPSSSTLKNPSAPCVSYTLRHEDYCGSHPLRLRRIGPDGESCSFDAS